MIQVSNTDAERICAGLEQWVAQSRENFKSHPNISVREINDIRRLSIILKKLNKKLDKVCPDRHADKNGKGK